MGESPIYLFELAATVITACLAAYLSDDNRRTFVLRVDNKAVLASHIPYKRLLIVRPGRYTG